MGAGGGLAERTAAAAILLAIEPAKTSSGCGLGWCADAGGPLAGEGRVVDHERRSPAKSVWSAGGASLEEDRDWRRGRSVKTLPETLPAGTRITRTAFSRIPPVPVTPSPR